MLEDKIAELIEAIKENTAAMKGGKVTPAGAVATTPPNKTAGAAKPTFEQVKAAVVMVKDSAGKPAAQKIIKEIGKAVELAAVKPAQYSAVLAACEAMLGEQEEEVADDPDAL